MASRMEKYYTDITNSDSLNKRSQKNKDLYRDIYDYGEYSNIEGVATMEKENEIDITKIKNMLKNRENYKKQKQYRQLTDAKTTYEQDETSTDFIEKKEEKVYDIRDILNKAKDKKPEEDTPRSLDNTNYNILKKLKLNESKKEYEEEDLKSLIDTITSTSVLNQLTDKELGLDMFNLEDSTTDIKTDNDSIKKVLEQAKKDKMEKKEEPVIDNSFYTSSLNFSKDDFEQANDYINKKKKTKLIFKILLFIVLILITALIIFGVYYLIK